MPNLWTPYAPETSDEDISDFTTTATSIKEESLSPAPPPPTPPQAPVVPYRYYIPASMEPILPPIEYYSAQMAFQYGEHPQVSLSLSTTSGYGGHGRSDSESLINDSEFLDHNPEYIIFERDALRAIAEANGGTLAGSNPRMRRSVQPSEEDGGYPQQRERNNAAAKLSRDRRKLREVKLALKVSFLEKQNQKLQAMLASGLCSKCFPHHDLY